MSHSHVMSESEHNNMRLHVPRSLRKALLAFILLLCVAVLLRVASWKRGDKYSSVPSNDRSNEDPKTQFTIPLGILSSKSQAIANQSGELKVPPAIGSLPAVHQKLVEQYLTRHPDGLSELADASSVLVHLDTAVQRVSAQFLSVTLDACAIQYNWDFISFEALRIINMAKALSPAMLRVGGTHENFIIFDPQGSPRPPPKVVDCYPERRVNFTLTPTHWDAVNQFVENVGWELTYGLNPLLRNGSSWDYRNAVELMKFTAEMGYHVNWELGNEPSHFQNLVGKGKVISPEQMAEDYVTLAHLVSSLSPSSSLLISGPHTTTIKNFKYLRMFLDSLKGGVLDAVAYHHYYTGGRTAKLEDFLSVSTLDKYLSLAVATRELVSQMQPRAELWLGETSSAYRGGAPGLSDSYVAGFMWLDKLGIAALTNHSRVFRQTFVGNNYSLLDSGQNPLPDYWLSVLYKQLVGQRVLYVLNSFGIGRNVRIYAHCAKSSPPGSVVLLLLNLHSTTAQLSLLNEQLVASSRDMYWLSPAKRQSSIPDDDVTSRQVTLNGHLLELVKDTELPELNPESQPASSTISLPPLSFGFYVFKDTIAKACL